MSPILSRPPRAPRSQPVKLGAQPPGVGKGTTASGKPTGALRATGPDEARRTTRGHQARQSGTPEATTKAHGQVPSNDGNRVPQIRAARTTRNEPRHRNRCQATPKPHTTNPSQGWPGPSGARTQAHTQPDIPARRGGARPRPEPKHKHPHRTPQPGVAGYKRSAHGSAHTPQHPSQEWRGAAGTRAQAHTPTPDTPARSGGVQTERAHKHTHTPIPQPGVAGRSRNPSPRTHTHTAHPRQGWRGTSRARTQTRTPQHPSQKRGGAAKTRAQTHMPTPHTQARSGAVQAERAHKNTHSPTPQPGEAGRSRNPEPKHTHPHTHPGQEWRGTSEAHTRADTYPNTPARSGGAQPKPEPKHTHARRTIQLGVAGYNRSARTNTHTQTPQPGVAGRSHNPSPNTHAHTAHPSQEWRGTSGARTQEHTQPNTAARRGGVQPKP